MIIIVMTIIVFFKSLIIYYLAKSNVPLHFFLESKSFLGKSGPLHYVKFLTISKGLKINLNYTN